MKPHIGGEEWTGLVMGAVLGLLAILGGLANAWAYLRRDPRLEKVPNGRRGALVTALIAVLVGSYFVWVSMIFILPKARAQSVAEQKHALMDELGISLPDMDPDLFLRYVKVGAIGVDDDIDGDSALEVYLAEGNLEAARRLVAAGASVNGHPPEQKTPLLVAIDDDNPIAVKFLLTHGADPNVAADHLPIFDAVNPDPDPVPDDPRHPYTGDDGDNPRPPDYASHHRLEITEALVAARANLNVRDDRTYTPLAIAAATGQCDVVAALLVGNPDQSIRAATGESAADWANQEHPECASLLRGTPASKIAAAALLARARPADLAVSERLAERHKARENAQEARARNEAEIKDAYRQDHPLGVFSGIVGNLILSMVLSTLLYVFHRIRSFLRGDPLPVHWAWVGVSSSSSGAYGGGGESASGDSDAPARGGASGGGGASREL